MSRSLFMSPILHQCKCSDILPAIWNSCLVMFSVNSFIVNIPCRTSILNNGLTK